jgi:peptidoglycan hydrolase CwlO-like protein
MDIRDMQSSAKELNTLLQAMHKCCLRVRQQTSLLAAQTRALQQAGSG